ncbi:MAG: hypothetical protein IJR26_04825 [Bacteroidales bacterium]|nr:hypothetical protein [Bacteroidales bacterium]
MDTVKFDEKSLSRYPVAFYFSAVEAFGKRIGAVECGLERFRRMRDEYDVLFKAFDEAYKRTQKSELTEKIAALDKERDGYAYVMQKVAELWEKKLEDESLAVHGRRVSQVFRDYSFRTSEALVAENAKIHNMEQKLADRELTADLQMMGLTELNRRLLSRTEQIEQLMGKRNEEKSDVVVGELKAAREKLDGHYRAFITYLNAVQELQPEESLSKAAQYYNADLAKIELQYQQSRKKGGKDEEPEEVAEQPEA